MNSANVLQHQYAFARASDECAVLATKGIWICTAWYGWDEKNKIAFLCHFDSPFSAFSVNRIVNELSGITPKGGQYKSILVGGKKWFWSKCTRNCIKELVATQNNLRISVQEGEYDNCFIDKRDVSICAKSGKVSN